MNIINNVSPKHFNSKKLMFQMSQSQDLVNLNQNIQTPVKKIKISCQIQESKNMNTAYTNASKISEENSIMLSATHSQKAMEALKEEWDQFVQDIGQSQLFQNFDKHIRVIIDDSQQHNQENNQYLEQNNQNVIRKVDFDDQGQKPSKMKLDFNFNISPFSKEKQYLNFSSSTKPRRVLTEECEGIKLFQIDSFIENQQSNEIVDKNEKTIENIKENSKTPPKKLRKASSYERKLLNSPRKENPFKDLNLNMF